MLGIYLGTDSAVLLPLLIGGGLLIAIGILGPRLSGRFALEWGASGTMLDIRTEIAPPGSVASERHRTMPTAIDDEQQALERATLPAPDPVDAEVIDSSGETIEIEVSDLEALIEAAESDEAASGGRGRSAAQGPRPA